MPCDTIREENQTISQRASEVRKAVDTIAKGVATGRIKVKVGPQGAIVFDGIRPDERNGVTDACAYRRLLASGAASALAKIAEAERLAGRQVDRRIVGQGVHSHDGGATWHGKG
jgi:hypothetical protein